MAPALHTACRHPSEGAVKAQTEGRVGVYKSMPYLLLTCMRYIELNPLRAGMVGDPGDYRWSSYPHHIGESVMDWLAEPEEYRRLAVIPEARARVYRELFKQPLAVADLEAIRRHLNKDCALGSSQFQDEIEATAGRRAKIAPQGRPKKRQES